MDRNACKERLTNPFKGSRKWLKERDERRKDDHRHQLKLRSKAIRSKIQFFLFKTNKTVNSAPEQARTI